MIKEIGDPPGYNRRYAIDPSKIDSKLGWEPTHSLEERLESTVYWYVNNQNWSRNVLKNLILSK